MENDISTLKNLYDKENIPVTLQWLEACVNWCKTEVLPRNYNLSQLKAAVHEQWLSLDLRELETSVLPPNLSDRIHMVLNGNFSLQMMQIMDISKPKHWQLQRIRNENVLSAPAMSETKDSVGSGKRMLQMTLTDGVQYIECMEFKPIRCLNINLTPGIKVRLIGPIVIRRGRLMLKEENIQILDGEVEELLTKNAAENVLARALKLPETKNPRKIDSKLLTTENEELEKEFNNKIVPIPVKNNIRNASNSNDQVVKDNVNSKQSLNLFPSDEDMEMLQAAENYFKDVEIQHTNKGNEKRSISIGSQSSRQSTASPDLFGEDFDESDLVRNHEKSTKTHECSIQIQDKSTKSSKQEIMSIPKDNSTRIFDELMDDDDDDLFNNLDLNEFVDENINLTTVAKLKENIKHSSKVCTCRTRAKFKGVHEKLTLVDNKMNISIKIGDETDDIICEVHNDVLTKWAQCTIQEIRELQKQIAQNSSEAKAKMIQALQNIKKGVEEIDSAKSMKIETHQNSVPVISEIFY